MLPFVLLQALAVDSGAPVRLETIEVRSTAQQITLGSVPGISELDSDVINLESATHPNELFDRVPGAWISRGSGQESLMAIRSPVLTGPGACGAFMVIEDRVPIRPAGFCNVNELFEINLLQAKRIDVVRGPGSAIYGSNALHGVIDVSSADPRPNEAISAGLMMGTDDYYRARTGLSGTSAAVFANYTDSGSFRENEGYEQSFINGSWSARALGADVRSQFSYAELDQDTAGYIFGENAYKDPEIRTGNVNPEAFRKVNAFRLSSRWNWLSAAASEWELVPFVRSSDMDFLQHFLPGKPLEENGQESAGLLFGWSPNDEWRLGVDLEWADGYLTQFQDKPTQGSDFLVETRPQGFHYDYDVRMLMGAAWAQYKRPVSERIDLTAGLRAETLRYRYRNNMLDGNTRDDGTECGFGGCLYTRPADRSDEFNNLAPELGINWKLSDVTTLHARIARGFRPPQATELYRLQRGQDIAALDSETLDTLELGVRGTTPALSWEITGFTMRKDNVISRDSNGFNVSEGKTDHLGVEFAGQWQMARSWRFSANATWAQHEYAFDRPASGIVSGNTVDTAPEWIAGARLLFQPESRWRGELEWVHMGQYFIDATNLRDYPGHDLVHLRGFYRLGEGANTLSLRITNLLDTDYAERADFAFGNYRYFPGAGRRYFIEWQYRP